MMLLDVRLSLSIGPDQTCLPKIIEAIVGTSLLTPLSPCTPPRIPA
jgi:hypothetical protein